MTRLSTAVLIMWLSSYGFAAITSIIAHQVFVFALVPMYISVSYIVTKTIAYFIPRCKPTGGGSDGRLCVMKTYSLLIMTITPIGIGALITYLIISQNNPNSTILLKLCLLVTTCISATITGVLLYLKS